MNQTSSTRCPDCRKFYAELFGHLVHCRRRELGLTLDQAATLSGITVWQWAAIEQAVWIPEHGPVLHSIAGTLEADYHTLVFHAGISRINQEDSTNRD